MDIRGFLERLLNEEEWRKKQVAKLPPATMSDSRAPTLEDRFHMMGPVLENRQTKDQDMQRLYRGLEYDGQLFGWPQPMPRNLWDVWISEELKKQRKPIKTI